MAIFGRRTARQRLRKPARESLAIPTFSPAADCKPWVIGGLWPAELSTPTSQTASVADHLRSDLQRFAARANEDLIGLRRKPMADSVRTRWKRELSRRRVRGPYTVSTRRFAIWTSLSCPGPGFCGSVVGGSYGVREWR